MLNKKTKSKAKIVCRKLKGFLTENEITYDDLAKEIGISENALTLKINGKRPWWFWEIAKVAKRLGFGDNFRVIFPELYESLEKSA